ncbi:MAG: acyloxyacyl hydrolase, partial [Bacteroidia bacterium]|nr:acyloxyacyl hydrolase [Bacteroidia bacterium]
MKKYLTYILLAIVQPLFLWAQKPILGHPDWLIKPAYNQCFIMVHRANVAHLVQGYPSVFELNVAKPTLGNTLWQLENNLPYLGLSFQYIAFKNPEELGGAFVLAPYVEIPLNKIEKPSRLYMRLCWGLSYLTKNFEMADNHKNVAIGSNWNAYVQFKWFWQIPINKNIQFEPGFTFNHASNGKIQNPNLGLNVLGVSAALNFKVPGKTKVSFTRIDSSTKVKSKYELMAFTAFGVNQRSIGSEVLGTFVFSTALQRNIRNTHKFSLGIDGFYDENYQTDYYNAFGKNAEGIDKWRISARIGYSYNVGRLSFPIEIGYYLFQKTNPDAMLVSRIGLRYYFANGLVAHWGLRTHYAVAYNFEFGLGYR